MEDLRMRKTFSKLALGIGVATVMGLPVAAGAAMTGVCSDCHTMHNSYEGASVATVWGETGVSPTPNEVLLKYDCLSCHAMQTGNAIETLAGGSEVPQVYGNTTSDLAGGNFAYIDGVKGSGANDRKGHNVVDLLNADQTLTGPPGYARGPADDQTNGAMHHYEMASEFTCAGKAGCHGVRNQLASGTQAEYGNGQLITAWGAPVYDNPVNRTGLAALTGAHHYNTDGVINTADEVYNSFRFLMGTKGLESDNYAWTNADHNEYYGDNQVAFTELDGVLTGCERCHVDSHGPETVGYLTNVTGTMTNFCETCHSNFHSSQDGTAGATGGFLRHPSDFVIPNKTEYAAISAWDPTAPVARTDYSSLSTSAAAGTDVVMCLSCHMSHGSDNAHMLRFDYATMVAGGGAETTGCFVCHTTKDTGTP
jgi:Zn-finger protein